jgi:murein DD-endopeptidase MepM/ murein hydrolase activator NlpD
MTNERRKYPSTTTPGAVKIGIIIASVIFLTLSAAPRSHANIHSPQGALDVASVLPGRYAFLKAAKNTAPAPETKPEPEPEPVAEEDGEDGGESRQVSINELIGLMRQATETSAMIAQEEKELSSIPGLGEAVRISSMLPRYKAPDPLSMIKSRQFLWPVDGFIYSAFNATRGRRVHGAIDIVASKGTPVAVAADGVVSVVANGGKNFSGYGKIVIVDHGQGVHTVYAHLDSYLVRMGERVRKGQYIATVGRTGRVTTNLLHYEVRVAGRKIDPLTCMEERPGVVKMVNYRSPKKK